MNLTSARLNAVGQESAAHPATSGLLSSLDFGIPAATRGISLDSARVNLIPILELASSALLDFFRKQAGSHAYEMWVPCFNRVQ